MNGEKSPEFACGQIMYSLKMSKLNYLVKETPYSVYLTIRKKFVREGTDSPSVTKENKAKTEVEAENCALKVKKVDLLSWEKVYS